MERIRMRTIDVARLFNRSASWLRELERHGVVPPAPRDFSGHRLYSREDIETIRNIVTSRRRNGGTVAA